jgi:hypothetical protein
MVRDRLLLLAGVQAEMMGLAPISALCRHKILSHNARHLVRSWPTLNAALADEAFQSYLKQLMRRYSQEKIEHMVHSLGIELGREREAYFDDLEYAAALLDTRPDSIDGILRGDQAAAQRKLSANGSPPMREPRSVATHGNLQRVLNLLVVWGPVLLVVLLAAIVTFVRAEHP